MAKKLVMFDLTQETNLEQHLSGDFSHFVNQVKLCGWAYIGATLKPDASHNASLTHLMGQ